MPSHPWGQRMGALKLKLDLFWIRFVPEVGMTDHDVPFEHGCKVIGLNFRCGHADESAASPPLPISFPYNQCQGNFKLWTTKKRQSQDSGYEEQACELKLLDMLAYCLDPHGGLINRV